MSDTTSSNKIFCIGFPKTATTSLEQALNLLGYKVCNGHYKNNLSNYLIALYMHQDYDEINRIISYYDGFCDLPWGGTDLYKYLANNYPDAYFVHSVREADSWYQSLEAMVTQLDDNLNTAMATFHSQGRYGLVYYLERVLNVKTLHGNRQNILARYNEHNKAIEEFFAGTDHAYLKMDIVSGDGWQQLCPFLSHEVPAEIFPSANQGKNRASASQSENQGRTSKKRGGWLDTLKKLK